MALPEFRIGKNRVEHSIMDKQKQDAEHRQAGSDEMKNRKDFQVAGVNPALVSG